MTEPLSQAIEVFYSYSHVDEALRNELEKHLKSLQRQGLITQWHDRRIDAGTEWASAIDIHLDIASVILLLISSDFIASDYCYDVEMQRAMERHEAGEATVIPIILRPADWQGTPFAKLQALPTNAKPITSWQNRDEAFLDVAKGIRAVIAQRAARTEGRAPFVDSQPTPLPVWNIPYARNPFFTNRDETLKQLYSTLRTSKTPALAGALSGMSGVGKTQAVVEYAYRYRDDYQHVFWVSSDTYETLLTDVVTITDLLQLPGKNAQDQSAATDAFKRWLQQHSHWLLIFDNADNLTLIRNVLPVDAKGHVLLTTQAYALGGLARRVDIEKMAHEEGALFLLRRASIISPDDSLSSAAEADVASARKIAELMGGLPLALDQAGAYIEEVACSLSGYLDLYQIRQAELLKRRGGVVTDHPEPVANTLALSFQKVQQANPAAAELLNFCAFLHPDAIPEDLISSGAAELGSLLHPVAADPFKLDAALAELRKFSLIHRDPTTRTLAIHRLTQIVLKDAMNEATRRLWAERTVYALNRVFPNPRFFAAWPLCQLCLPHCQVCAELIAQWNLHFPAAIQLLNRTGYYLMRRGVYAQAAVFYQQALAIGKQFLAEEQHDATETLYRLAELHYMLGKYAEAEPLYQQALAIRERVLGTEHPDVALSLHNLALLYADWGKYTGVEQLYQQALAIWEKTLGPQHPDVAEGLSNLAVLYISQRRYAEAEPLLRRSLVIREKAFGEDNPDTVLSVYFLAKLYLDEGKDAEAEPLLRRGLRMCEQVLGPEHPYMAAYLGSLALIARRQGRYEDAEGFYQQAREISERSLGPEHPDVASTLSDLAEVYREQHKYQAAEPLYQQALKIQEQVHGPEHPEVASLLENYAALLRATQRDKEAEIVAIRARAIRENSPTS
jgi:tetratricopeptide (TPR) repeat protein